ncbi:MAG: cryptochrome/photolyase family protein [Legionella sp.]
MSKAIVWFRQDLRVTDNPVLAAACRQHQFIIPIYIWDELSHSLGGAQRWWLHHSLISLEQSLQKIGLNLCLRQGNALAILEQLVAEHHIGAVYWNRCYDPAAIQRDTQIKKHLQLDGVDVVSANGSLLHEPWDIRNAAGGFFKVFTPFWRTCINKLIIPEEWRPSLGLQSIPVNSDALTSWELLPTKPNWAEHFGEYWQPGEKGAQLKLHHFIEHYLCGYHHRRDIPNDHATSKLSPHLHFGEISPWQVWRAIDAARLNQEIAIKSVERFCAELGWREFSYHLLYHEPTIVNNNFKKIFNQFPWANDDSSLRRWQQGQTGYPIVDAGMRELWSTGYMHNRVRMIVASFLTKDLFIDWRRGASWFWDTLLDADLASNSASWQWVAGCGADAAPYFRIFNPVLQGEKFDPQGAYVKRWVPELRDVPVHWIHQPWLAPAGVKNYPPPMVDHAEARKMALSYYKMINDKQVELNDQ